MAIPPQIKDDRSRGIAWMLATYFWFLVLDSLVKAGLTKMSLVEVTWGRFFFATLIAVAISGKRLPAILQTDAPAVQMTRSFLMMVTTFLFNAGIARVPLATASTIMFLSPIFVTLLSIIILKERVGPRRWLGIVTGFVGAIIVIYPDLHQSHPGFLINYGVLFIIAAATTNAAYQVTTRRLRHDDPMTSLIFTTSAGAVVTSFMLPWFWTGPSASDFLLLVAIGAAGLAGHFCLIRAFRFAPASVVAPFAYTSLLWASLFGYLFWGEVPTKNTLLGATLIVIAGLYIFYREKRLLDEKNRDEPN